MPELCQIVWTFQLLVFARKMLNFSPCTCTSLLSFGTSGLKCLNLNDVDQKKEDAFHCRLQVRDKEYMTLLKDVPSCPTVYMRCTGGEVGATSALAPKIGPLGLVSLRTGPLRSLPPLHLSVQVTECNPVEAQKKPGFRKQGGPDRWASLCRKVWNKSYGQNSYNLSLWCHDSWTSAPAEAWFRPGGRDTMALQVIGIKKESENKLQFVV